MSLHSWSCQGTLKPSNCATFTLNFTGAELPQAKKTCIYALRVVLVVSNSLHPCRLWPARLLCQGGSPGQNTGVGSHSLLQGIFPTQGVFPTQGSNPSLLYCRPILYHLSHIAAYSLGMKYSSFSAWLYTHEVFSPLYSITFSLSTTQS